MRVVVCGGRNVGRTREGVKITEVDAGISRASEERALVLRKLSALHAERVFTQIIGGEEGGAERLGKKWAELNGVPFAPFGRERRGFRRETLEERNIRMLTASRPDAIICFGSGETTEKLVAQARALRIPVWRVATDPDPRAAPVPPTPRAGLGERFTI